MNDQVMQFGGVQLGNGDTNGKLQDFSSVEAWVSHLQCERIQFNM